MSIEVKTIKTIFCEKCNSNLEFSSDIKKILKLGWVFIEKGIDIHCYCPECTKKLDIHIFERSYCYL